MGTLINKTKQIQIASTVLEAKDFYARTKGLLGQKDLEKNTTLWIHRCNSIHTWFMKFSIDAIFVDKNLIVKAVYKNLKPWRITRLVLPAKSVFELAAGTLTEANIEIGDQLYVGH